MRVTPSCDSINSICVSDASGIQKSPDVIFGGGSYFTVWSDARGGSNMIFGARVAPSGTVVDTAGIAISTSSGDTPVVEFDGSRFFVVWSSMITIKGMFVTTGGAPQDSVTVSSGFATRYAPNIAFDGIDYLVVWVEWVSTTYEVCGQFVSPAGALIGSKFSIGTTSLASKPGISFDGTNYIITWTLSNDIWARQYDTSGAPLGPAFLVSNHPDNQYFPDVAAGANRYLFVWTQYGTSGFDVYGNVDVVVGAEEKQIHDFQRCRLRTLFVTNYLHVDYTEERKIAIFDINGKQVISTTHNKIDCRNLASGVYFVKIPGCERFKFIRIK